MAKIDILLPFWGDVDLFKKTVNSVMNQTCSDWHLYIFDDCYPSEEPRMFVNSLEDGRITYYRHSKNIGITNNFNYALEAATSEHCIMIGCDDIMLPSYVETALRNISNAAFYQPGVEVIDKNDRVYLPLGDRIKRILRPSKAGLYKGEKLATSLCHGNWMYFPSILWKTSIIKKFGFDPQYKIAEDLVLELNIIKDGGDVYLDNEVTFRYRRFSESLSSKEKGKNGVRFSEEDAAYAHFQTAFQKMGWIRASRAAKLHLTSRIHRII